MPSRTDYLARSPFLYYELEEAAAPFVDTQANGDNATTTGPIASITGTVGNGLEVGDVPTFGRVTFHQTIYDDIATAKDYSIIFAYNANGSTVGTFALKAHFDYNFIRFRPDPTTVQIEINHAYPSDGPGLDILEVTDPAGWNIVGITYNSTTGFIKTYVNGVLVGNDALDLKGEALDFYEPRELGEYDHYISSREQQYDNYALYLTTLSDADMIALTFVPPPAEVFTTTTPLYVGGAENLTPIAPLWVTSPLVFTPATPIEVRAADVTHPIGDSADWGLEILVDGVAVELVDTADTSFSEDEAPVAQLTLYPPAGALDPEEWENKSITIDFIGYSYGTELYRERRFTGVTELADYDVQSGRLALRATGDLQGKLERMTNEDIAAIVGGGFSEHVFSDDRSGYDYARDVLETAPRAMHVTVDGSLEVVDWAAKTGADITFTDASRFDDTLDLVRAKRGDLINKSTVSVDFRFPRLRHREIGVNWYSPTAWCDYLELGFNLCQKSTVDSAYNSTGWTVLGNITYEEIPPADTYTCGGVPRVWVGGQDLSAFCLGASATLGRRWVQTVTETATFTVQAPDSIARTGELAVIAGYGLEATYNADDWEQSTDFDSAPAGAVFHSSGDFILDDDGNTYDGRAAYETAQTVAVSREITKILSRHRRNTVSLSPVYRPDVELNQTARVETPGLVCQGKIRSYSERFNLQTGRVDLDVDIALSRHGGSGIATPTPVAPVAKPDAPAEDPIPLTVYAGYHIGGLTLSLPEDDGMEGYICNAGIIEDVAKLYSKRFRIVLPAIGASSRNAVEVTTNQAIEVEIPQDELTLTV